MSHVELYYGHFPNLQIVIIGCGALGSNIASALVRQGATNIHLVDFDRVEESNLATTVYSEYHCGELKVNALKSILQDIRPDADIYAYNVNITRSERRVKPLRWAHSPNVLVLDCVDNSKTRRFLADKDWNILHVGINDSYGECRWNEDYVVPQDAGVPSCEIPYSLNLILVMTGLAVDQVYKYGKDEHYDLGFDLVQGRVMYYK